MTRPIDKKWPGRPIHRPSRDPYTRGIMKNFLIRQFSRGEPRMELRRGGKRAVVTMSIRRDAVNVPRLGDGWVDAYVMNDTSYAHALRKLGLEPGSFETVKIMREVIESDTLVNNKMSGKFPLDAGGNVSWRVLAPKVPKERLPKKAQERLEWMLAQLEDEYQDHDDAIWNLRQLFTRWQTDGPVIHTDKELDLVGAQFRGVSRAAVQDWITRHNPHGRSERKKPSYVVTYSGSAMPRGYKPVRHAFSTLREARAFTHPGSKWIILRIRPDGTEETIATELGEAAQFQAKRGSGRRKTMAKKKSKKKSKSRVTQASVRKVLKDAGAPRNVGYIAKKLRVSASDNLVKLAKALAGLRKKGEVRMIKSRLGVQAFEYVEKKPKKTKAKRSGKKKLGNVWWELTRRRGLLRKTVEPFRTLKEAKAAAKKHSGKWTIHRVDMSSRKLAASSTDVPKKKAPKKRKPAAKRKTATRKKKTAKRRPKKKAAKRKTAKRSSGASYAEQRRKLERALKGLSGLVIFFLLSGCAVTALRKSTRAHSITAEVIRDSCEKDGWGNGKCTQADLDHLADEARCIEQITALTSKEVAKCQAPD